MSGRGFTVDRLIRGSIGEKVAERALYKRFGDKIKSLVHCDNKDCDFIINEKILIEVKNDNMSYKTGNVAIEIECRGKPSGINTTKANYWVQIILGEPYITTPSLIKKILKSDAVPKKFVVGGDKGSNTKMVLFKQKDFIKICEKL